MNKILSNMSTCSILTKVFLMIGTFLSLKIYAQTDASDVELLNSFLNQKTYWFYPRDSMPYQCKNVEFFENGKRLSLDLNSEIKIKFGVDGSPYNVRINDQINASVKFDSIEKEMFIYSNDDQYLKVCFSDIEPKEHYNKVAKIEIKKNEVPIGNKKEIRIGMTEKQVREKTNWGSPISINSTVTSNGTREQWVYGYGSYLYFRNGILESIQFRK